MSGSETINVNWFLTEIVNRHIHTHTNAYRDGYIIVGESENICVYVREQKRNEHKDDDINKWQQPFVKQQTTQRMFVYTCIHTHMHSASTLKPIHCTWVPCQALKGLKIWDLNLSGRHAQRTIKSNENNGTTKHNEEEKKHRNKNAKDFSFQFDILLLLWVLQQKRWWSSSSKTWHIWVRLAIVANSQKYSRKKTHSRTHRGNWRWERFGWEMVRDWVKSCFPLEKE